MPVFNELIAQRRKELGLSQKEVATLIFKEDAQPISPQYLNDLEHARRAAPSDHLMREFSRVLKLDLDLLFYSAGALSPELRNLSQNQTAIGEAIQAFRKRLEED